jgi:protein-S-isoprenylcysteine O-methyltransferase Ste14
MRSVADALAILVLMVQLPVPVFWLLIHPTVGFWRRRPWTWYYRVAMGVWLLAWVLLLIPYHWWLGQRFPWHPLLALAALGLISTDVWLIRQAEHRAGWRVLVGMPEIRPREYAGNVMSGGIYDRVRHPRYLGMVLSWWAAVLLSSATRLLALVLAFTALATLVVELEERELLPRFIPRRRLPLQRAGD